MSIEKFALLMSRRKLWFTRVDILGLGDDHEGSSPDALIEDREQRLRDRRVLEKIGRGSKGERRNIFVSCWSKHAPKDLLMWKIYTPHATGIAVETTVNRLSNCFVSQPNDLFENFHARIEEANYIGYDSHKADNDFDPFIHKQKAYVYEKEVRVVIGSWPTVDEPSIGKELKVNLDLLINKIYVSPHRPGDGLERFVEDLLLENHLKKDIIRPSFVRTAKF